jgi:drug/metabolite transporter (DMT)-like permease
MADSRKVTLTRRQQVQHTLLLVLAAFVWGMAFAAQAVGAEYVGAFTFLAARNWIAALILIPVVRFFDHRAEREYGHTNAPVSAGERRDLLLGSLLCGFLLCAASGAQQAGIAYTTTAKSGFITALYCVIVPVLSIFLGRRPSWKIALCVILAVIGLYLLCMSGDLRLSYGDSVTLLSAVLFAFQILTVGYFSANVDGVRLAQGEFLATAVFATVVAVLFEDITLAGLKAALFSILYAGVMSSAVGYTLQILGQKSLDPTIASLAMCLESVFSALSGWVFLGQTMSPREMLGAAIMFAAIVLAQIL